MHIESKNERREKKMSELNMHFGQGFYFTRELVIADRSYTLTNDVT